MATKSRVGLNNKIKKLVKKRKRFYRFKVALELILEGFPGSKKRTICCFLQAKSNAEKHDVVNQSTCAQNCQKNCFQWRWRNLSTRRGGLVLARTASWRGRGGSINISKTYYLTRLWAKARRICSIFDLRIYL